MCVCFGVLKVFKRGRKVWEKKWEWESNVLWEESVTLPVSLGASSPQGRRTLQKKTGLGTGRRGKRDDETTERRREGVEGILYSENSQVCRCADLNVRDCNSCREHLVFTEHLKHCITTLYLTIWRWTLLYMVRKLCTKSQSYLWRLICFVF